MRALLLTITLCAIAITYCAWSISVISQARQAGYEGRWTAQGAYTLEKDD